LSNRDVQFAIGDSNADEGRPRLIRSAVLSAFAEAARTLGLDPYHMLRRAGLPVTALDHPDYLLPADRIQALLADSAKAANSEEFGLAVGACFKLSMLGSVSLLLREQPTLRDAITALARYIRYQNENVEVWIEPRPQSAMVVLRLLSARTRASRLMMEMTVAQLVQIVRALIGDEWRPSRVVFAHAPPSDVGPYRRLLGEVEFRAPHSGVELTEEELATPLPEADADMARQVARFIEANILPANARMSETVQALIQRLLPDGECSVDRVAQHLGFDRRTVHRRLAAEGHSFTELLDGARRQVATWQLSHGDQPLSEVTHMVGFSSLSTFSRWFRQAYGIQPSEYRRLTQSH
jgi:AraC-like DNA-binding protein